jgi:GNAT superfamily N-acetyltransferase
MQTSPGIINKKDPTGFFVERLTGYNLADLGRLHKEVYGSPRPDNYFEKKYDTLITGIEKTGFIAYDHDHFPVGYFGVIPCLMQSGDQLILTAQAADAMTHPRFRKEGIFTRLSEMCFDLCRSLGIKLLFGFPNQNSYPVMVRSLGWQEAGKMDRFTIGTGVSWNWIFARKSATRQQQILDPLIMAEPMIGNSAVGQGYAGIYRDKNYMSYKNYSDNYVINMQSARAWIRTGGELTIGDIVFKEGGSDRFFGEIKKLARELGIPKISFQVSRGCELHKLFAAKFKPIPSFPVLLKDFDSGLSPDSIKFSFADIDIF